MMSLPLYSIHISYMSFDKKLISDIVNNDYIVIRSNEVLGMVKQTTISVRLSDDLLKKFDAVTKIIPLSKPDFIRGCIEKLCDDNEILVDYHQKTKEYLEFIKAELSKLPQDLVIVKNGSWKDVKDSTMFILCDEFWRASKAVFTHAQKLSEKYDIDHEEIQDFSTAEESEGMLDLEDIALLVTEKTITIEPLDIPDFVSEDFWSDDTEISKVTLSYATRKAIEEKSAEKIVKDYLQSEEKRAKEKLLRLVIDARGEFRRAGNQLYMPVFTEIVEPQSKSNSSKKIAEIGSQ